MQRTAHVISNNGEVQCRKIATELIRVFGNAINLRVNAWGMDMNWSLGKFLIVSACAVGMASTTVPAASKDKKENPLQKAEIVYEGTYTITIVTPAPSNRNEGVISGLLNSAINSKSEKLDGTVKFTLNYDGRIVQANSTGPNPWGTHNYRGTYTPKRRKGDCKLVTSSSVIKSLAGKCNLSDLQLSGQAKGSDGKTYKVKMALVATGYTDLLERDRRRSELLAECNDPNGRFAACTELEELDANSSSISSNVAMQNTTANVARIPNNAAHPRNNPGAWIRTNDFRPSWVRRNLRGQVGYSVIVSPQGRVSNCSITRSSGHVELNETTCRLISLRARFRPATDSNGDPIVGRYDGSVTWNTPAS